MDQIENLLLEHLKKIQAEKAAARDRDSELLKRLAHIESTLAQLGKNEAGNYGEIIQDRHAIDKLIQRIERIERRLDLAM